MAVNYTALAAKAKTLINDNGRTVTLRRTDETAADASKPWRGQNDPDSGTVVDVSAIAVIVPTEDSDQEGDLIRMGSSTAYVAASDDGGNDLRQFDYIIDGSETWKIEEVVLIQPGDTQILYMMELTN